jgi:hypothetical protein
MSELITLKDKLSRDPFFRALFNKADSTQEAIGVASAFGIYLSIEDVLTFRKELRSMIGNQSFNLDFVRPEKLSWNAWGGGEDTSCGGGLGGGCSGSGYGGSCSDN